MAGFDSMKRDLISIYDMTDYSNSNCTLFTKQISDFPIRQLRYVDHTNPNMLVSCGKGNICFWQVKNKFLTIQPVNLNDHAHGNIFNQVDVLKQKTAAKQAAEGQPKTAKHAYFVYVASSQGFMYLIDYSQGEMKSVLKLHNVHQYNTAFDNSHQGIAEPQFHSDRRCRQLRAHMVDRFERAAVRFQAR
jgi:hypothetical protein